MSLSSLYELILKRRTIRRFKQKKIKKKILIKIINAGRLAPSAGNLQPIEYILVMDKKINDKIFENVKLGKYFEGWVVKEEERPRYYVILIVNKNINKDYEFDCGCASENICLAALSFGIGSCIIKSINKEKLKKIIGLKGNYDICNVIALGYPDEKSVCTNLRGSVKYFRKGNTVYVPKRSLSKIVRLNKF
ncbi:MAG: nitroreductase family protein [bacterium]|nr:nitroreductase family protein [bacterium]MDW8164715.1 nitroreductase family protein [Candidatus Omnitrophota bacterium]